ncbi:MAG: capsular polysaccharide synthesis protein [Snowella sp.]|nr:capsular polysaccharide synthesis protein [Snowella sp.]
MLNKTIWLLWLQGWDKAPWLIQQVAESWKINNPEWTIKYLDFNNINQYVNDINYLYDETKEISPQHQADIIRLSLLKNHGGVWADATMLCMQPLNPWVEEAVQPAGLWMYHGHGAGMDAMSGPTIWFIASEKNSLLINKWKSACDQYWLNRTHADSYYWLDGLFKNLFESDKDFRRKWNLAPYLYSEATGQAHSLCYRTGRMSWSNIMIHNTPKMKKIYLEKPPYALKLCWKEWQDNFPDVNSSSCQNSNGYFAIKMSKRKFVYKHQMFFKNSFFLRFKIFATKILFNLKFFPLRIISLFTKIRSRIVFIFT